MTFTYFKLSSHIAKECRNSLKGNHPYQKNFNTGDCLFWREKTIRGYQFSFLSTHTRIAFFLLSLHCFFYRHIELSLFALNLLVNATFKKLKSLT